MASSHEALWRMCGSAFGLFQPNPGEVQGLLFLSVQFSWLRISDFVAGFTNLWGMDSAVQLDWF
jgi:hypothetical protein